MKYYNLWRDYDMLTAILANTGTVIYFWFYEVNMKKHRHTRNPEKWPNAMHDPYNMEPENNLCRMVVLALTLCSMFCMFLRHKYKVEWQRSFFSDDKQTKLYYRYKEVTAEKFDIFQPKNTYLLNSNFIFEFLMISVTPIPYYDCYITHRAKRDTIVHYFLSEIMLSIMALRLFLIVRAYFNFSIYADSYSKKLFQQYGFGANIAFSFKA
jgi:hypothetical protein